MSNEARKMGNEGAYPKEGSSQSGLTKRELFAAMAMQGMVGVLGPAAVADADTSAELALKSVACADALLDELAK